MRLLRESKRAQVSLWKTISNRFLTYKKFDQLNKWRVQVNSHKVLIVILLPQVDFNMANDRHLTRVNEKAEDAGNILEGLHDILRDTMDTEYQSRQTITSYQNLQNNFEVFCTQYR